MAALMRSVKVVRAINLRHSVFRSISSSNKSVANHTQPSVLRNALYSNRNVGVLIRQSSSAAPDVAIIEQQQGRRDHDSPSQRRNVRRISPSEAAATPPTIGDSMKTLHDITASKTGIVTPAMLNRILRLLGKDDVTLSPRDSIFLLQCTGQSLIFTAKKDRETLLKKILAKYEEVGIQLTTGHYNAILQSNTENGTEFNPVEFLANMEAKGGSPNPMTYQYLIAKFCSDGNVDAASEILQHMKQSSIPVSEDIFASFIIGYMKTGNSEKAKQIPAVMSASGIEPTERSFATFLQAYAEQGNIEGVRETLTGARVQGIELQDEHIYGAVMKLAESNNEQYIPEMLDVIVHRGSELDQGQIVRSLRQLVAGGHADKAVQVFNALSRTNPNTILMPMIATRNPFASFVDIANRFDAQLFTQENLEILAKFVNRTASPSMGIEILHFLQSKGLSVTAGPVRRFLGRLNGQGSVEAIYKAAALFCGMHADHVSPLVYDTSLVTWHLLQRVESVEDIHTKLQDLGFANDELPVVTFLGYLRSGQFQAAVKYGEDNSDGIKKSTAVSTESSPLRDVILQGYQNSGHKLDVMLDAVSQCTAILNLQPHQLSSEVFLRFVSWKDFGPEEIEKYLKMIQDKDMKVLTRYKRAILKELGSKQVSPSVVSVLEKVLPPDVPGMVDMQKIPTAELEKMLPELRESRNLLHIANASRILLRRYCAGEKSDEMDVKIDELVELMERNKSSYDFMTLKALINFYAMSKQDLPVTVKLYRDVTDRFRNYKDTFRLVLIVATLQAQSGYVADAFATVEAHLNGVESTEEFSKSKMLAGNCVKLLNALDTKEDIDRMYSLLIKGFVTENTYSLMKGVIMAHMKVQDTEAVVQDLLKFANDHKIDPDQELLGEVLSFLIKEKDDANLKKVMAIVTTSKGQVYGQHALVKELISQGNVEEAKSALEKFQPEPSMALMNRICNSFFREKKVDAMTELLRITRDMKGVDREQMIFWLLKLHVKLENSSAALDTFVMFQAENITPQRRTLRTVGELLNSLNVAALPSQLLDPSLMEPETSENNKPEQVDGDRAKPESIPAEPEASKLEPEVAIAQEKPAPVETNQLAEFISQLKSNPNLLKKYCIRSNLSVAAKHCPEFCNELETLVLSEPGPETTESLVQHYCDVGRLQDAQRLMEKHPQYFSKPQPDLFTAMSESMLVESKYLFGSHDGGAVLERLMMLRLEGGDWQGALQYYHDALQDNVVLSDNTLTVLETMLRVHNQPVPWENC